MENGESKKRQLSGWEKAEIIAKIFSLVLIPIVLVVGGWLIQTKIAHTNTEQEYVKLAISILNNKQENNDSKELRNWAVDLLNKYSPIELTKEQKEGLSTGKINLPTATSTPFTLENIYDGHYIFKNIKQRNDTENPSGDKRQEKP